MVPIIVPLVGLVAFSVPATAHLGGQDDTPVEESEGVIASTTNLADSKGSFPPPAGHENCVRYLSSALTLSFTGDELAHGVVVTDSVTGFKRTYNTGPNAPVLAEVRGDTPDRYDGPSGSYTSSQGDVEGCHIADAGSTALTFNTSAPGGIVKFVGAADLNGESLDCTGGASTDTFERGGIEGPTIRIELHNVACTITPLASPFSPVSQTFASVMLKAKIRPLPSPPGGAVCNPPFAPNACELEWAYTDLG